VDESDWYKVYTSIKLEEKWTDIIKEAIDKRYQQSNTKVERTNIIKDEGDWQVRYTQQSNSSDVPAGRVSMIPVSCN
jgi:cation diffusion facilitator CzcD-associated flavoprotein CzcO